MTEIDVLTEVLDIPKQIQLGVDLLDTPEEVLSRGQEIADAINRVIKGQNLYITLGGKAYVFVEGWMLLGGMLNTHVIEVPGRTRLTTELDKETWEAECELVDNATGKREGYGTAICSRYENKWSKRDSFALRSMAITRAAGKAHRLRYGWIMRLAGYSGTPAEEMASDDGYEEAVQRARDTHPAAYAASTQEPDGKPKKKVSDPDKEKFKAWAREFVDKIELEMDNRQLGDMIKKAFLKASITFDANNLEAMQNAVMEEAKHVKAERITQAKAEQA